MGQLCCGGQTRHAGAATEDVRPERTLQRLQTEEHRMLPKVRKHLRNVIPALLTHVQSEKAMEFGDNIEDLLQTVVNTIRRALISYSKAYSGDWFKKFLTPVEAMMVIHLFIEKHGSELTCDFAKAFLGHFKMMMQKLFPNGVSAPPTSQPQLVFTGAHWKETAELVDFFMQADSDAGGDLSIDEIERIIHRQNIGMEGAALHRRILEVDTSGDRKLNFQEFISFFQKLTFKRYIQQVIFKDYVRNEPKEIMKPHEFYEFMKFSQRFEGDFEAAKKLLQQLKKRGMAVEYTTADGTRELGMSSRHLALLLTCFPHNAEEERQWARDGIMHSSCYDPLKTTKVYHDMNRPMTDYFIASSHNTYLDHGQLTGQSSGVAYQNALILGCRCVELDCWDGDDGDPIVYHGHTMTSQVKFENVIKAINQYAFKRSQYPVILSLEVHTSPDQQTRMGQIMKHHFRRVDPKDRTKSFSILHPPIAFTDHRKTDRNFTPAGLKGYILVKGKMLKRDDDMFAEHLRLVRELHQSTRAGQRKLQLDADRGADDEDDVEAEKTTEIKKSSAGGKKVKLSPELSSCVWMKSVHFRGYEDTMKKGNHWDVSSFSEGAVEKHYATDKSRQEFAECNKVVFSRVYPGATRVNSDNYHPQPSWNMGCQVVALNYQIEFNRSPELRYNLAKFRDNGQCGYLLKPPPLREPGRHYDDFHDNCVLTVEIIQGFRLPKPDKASKGEKIDPYVLVGVSGIDKDKSIVYKTKTIDDNGWNPEWFEVKPDVESSSPVGLSRADLKEFPENTHGGNLFKFHIDSVEMALLTLQVYDYDGLNADDFIGEAIVPVRCLRQGYRCVPLKSEVYTQLDSILFCRFQLDYGTTQS